jgi:hypothetical protein
VVNIKFFSSGAHSEIRKYLVRVLVENQSEESHHQHHTITNLKVFCNVHYRRARNFCVVRGWSKIFVFHGKYFRIRETKPDSFSPDGHPTRYNCVIYFLYFIVSERQATAIEVLSNSLCA